MENRPAKLARLSQLRGNLPHMSQPVLAAVIAAAKQAPLPYAGRRKDVREATGLVARTVTAYGAVH